MEKVSQSGLLERRGAVPLAVNVDLRFLVFPLFIAFLVSAPVMRGLFFPADLFPHLVGLGIILLLCAFQVILKKQEVFHGFMPFGFLWLAAAYGGSCLVAAVRPEAVRGFLRYVGYFAVFWIAAYLSRTRAGRRAISLSIFAGATLIALVGVLSATGVFVFPGAFASGQIMSTLQYPNALAAYLLFSSVIGLTFLCVERNAVLRATLSMATVVQALVFLASYSRGGWVVYPVALGLMFLGMPQAQRARLAFYACTTLTAVLLVIRRFTETIAGKTPADGLKYVLFGLAISLLFDAAYMLFARVSSTLLSPPARRVLGWAGGAYAAITLGAYLVALAGQYSSGVAGVLSASMLRAFRSISFDDPSLLTRAFASRDALRIWQQHPILGGGAGAWNAWYHSVQTVLYWTTEVHNHFAQVLVETGLFGFAAYLFIWGGLIFSAVRFMLSARRRNLLEDSTGVAVTWGLAVACFAVGIHSAMDFELSMPGVAVQLWAMFGVVYESILDARSLHAGHMRTAVAKPQPSGKMNGSVAGSAVALLSVLLIVPPLFLMRGAWYGGLGAAALTRQDFYTAIQLYDRAETLDPFTASYSLDKAQAYAAMALLEGRDDAARQALAELDRAERLEPYNLVCKVKQTEILTSLGEVGKALDVSRDFVALLPLELSAYETFARLSLVSYMDALGNDPAALAQDPGAALAGAGPLQDVTGIPGMLEALRWSPDKLKPTPTLNTYIGQAYYLGGDLGSAMRYFSMALADKKKPPEAQVWMTAARIQAGELPATGASGEVLDVLSYYRPVPR